MAKITILRTISGPSCYYKKGQIIEVSDSLAASLVGSGHAIYAEAPKIEMAVAKQPAKKTTKKK
jgi:hypothetical protein